MIGTVILTAAAVMGVTAMMRHRHRMHAWGYGGCGRGFGRHGHHGPWGYQYREGGFDEGGGAPFMDDADAGWRRSRRGRGPRQWMLDAVLTRLDASPAQERAIVAAVEELQADLAKQRGEGEKTRTDLGAALRKPIFDEVLLGELYARHDTVIEEARKTFVGFFAKVHEALDDKQRERLAAMLERGPRFWGWR